MECRRDQKQTHQQDQTQVANQQGEHSLQKNKSTPKKRKLDKKTTYGNEIQLFCAVHHKKIHLLIISAENVYGHPSKYVSTAIT